MGRPRLQPSVEEMPVTSQLSLDDLEKSEEPVSPPLGENERLQVASEPSSPSLGAGAPARSRLRPILCKSHSVDIAPHPSSGEKRSVSFRLPKENDHSSGRMAALAQSLKRLTLAAAAAGASRAKPEKTTKRILRQPVVHVYLRGASGLPTQRVPLASVSALQHQPFRASIL